MVNIGEAIGVIAAQSIGEPGTQLTMRTFHIGGTASRRAEQTTLEARNDGIVKFINVHHGRRASDGDLVVMNRNGEIAIVDFPSRAASASASATRSSTAPSSRRSDGEQGEGRRDDRRVGSVHHPDPHRGRRHREVRRHHRRRHHGGAGRRAHRPLDQGHHRHARTLDKRPRISIKDADGKTAQAPERQRGALPAPGRRPPERRRGPGASSAGDVIAKIPRETTKTKDITGGLPRVAELFEARKPKEFAVVTEIDGVVSFGKDTKGKRKVVVTPEVGEPREYLIPKGKHISVHEGDFVRAGEPLMDGSSNPHDILTILGEKALAKYLVDEVQEIYRLQGVRINDKHIEVIVRQMLRRVRIKEVGDTEFLIGDQVEKWRFEEENQRVLEKGGAAGDRRAAAARHHQGEPVDRELHLGGVVPGDDQGAHRGRDQRQGRPPARAQGERHHGPPDPGRHRRRRRTTAWRSVTDEPTEPEAPAERSDAGERGGASRRPVASTRVDG